MAYDEVMAERIRDVLTGRPAVTEKRMFGGLAFLLDGHMAIACGRDGFMVRVVPERSAMLLDEPVVRRQVMRGRELAGWLHVDPSAVEDDEALERWVGEGVRCVETLPAVTPGRSKRAPRAAGA